LEPAKPNLKQKTANPKILPLIWARFISVETAPKAGEQNPWSVLAVNLFETHPELELLSAFTQNRDFLRSASRRLAGSFA
jgi:hypothetical protein